MRKEWQSFSTCAMQVLRMQALYESSLAFGLRKVLQSEEGKDELGARGAAAEAQAADLREQARAHACACAHAGLATHTCVLQHSAWPWVCLYGCQDHSREEMANLLNSTPLPAPACT